MKDTQKLVLLFDGSCNFCTACAEFFRILDRRHRLQCLPFQIPGIPQSYGLTIAQCEQAAWVIAPNGDFYPGAQAVSIALDAALGLPFFLSVYRLPGIGRIEDKIYAWMAKNRRFFPGIRPYCERPHSLCGEQRGGENT